MICMKKLSNEDLEDIRKKIGKIIKKSEGKI
jgi:hypothetical protein